jgi:epoxide hydrolase-like predicted phosphatase
VKPELLLFDLDGVLVAYDRPRRWNALGAALGLPAETVHAAIINGGIEFRYDRGELDSRAYLEACSVALGVQVTETAWVAARHGSMSVPGETIRAVSALARQAEVAILTNNGPMVLDLIPILMPEIWHLFEGRVVSSVHFGIEKPAPRVYELAVERLGHRPERTLFFDDLVENVAGARAAGLLAEHVPVPGQLTEIAARHGFARALD